MSFSEVPHTADVRIRATSPTLEGLFSDCFLALMQVMYGKNRGTGVAREISVAGSDTEALLLDFLSESLFVSEVDGLVFSHAEVTFGDEGLHAALSGEPFDRAKHAGGTEVKGISYSGLVVRRDANGYMAEIVFDV
jgi:SHS2 domain-containing protein